MITKGGFLTMGTKRVGLARVEALLENLKRDINLVNATLTNPTITTSAIATFSGGILNSNVLSSNATSAAVDLSSAAADLRVFMTGTWSSTIKLPLASAANAGMCIEIFLSADADTDGTAIMAVENAGSTTIFGSVVLSSTGAKMDAIPIHGTTNNTKAIHFDADAADHAGGKEGTVARFYYQEANKIHAQVHGITSAATPALDGNAVNATGWS
jgi:hypothetical protein